MIEITVNSLGVRAPPTVSPDLPVSEAAQHLRRPAVPALVVQLDGQVVGIVTESDVVATVAETTEQPTVGEIMSTPVTTIEPTATLDTVIETMRGAGVKHLPVVRDGSYHGLLSADALSPYLSRGKLEIEWHGEPLRVDTTDGQEFTMRG
ncbi:CBS domain-containing protein [Natronococcus occultus]|uniref:Putative signal-transduction protein containing cAMP-binding and CBS domains n=1 Tax=Natronococcus occultus SP4 TaxID=694430 RepID=L0K3C6_9EURY|nr:CBS domain-containing protein [Natronococcus occultus]AGB39065.1 putative signal-transduction protein containing cAMP-binding and CBS domains [Natronococcus occultus SP4]